MDSRRNEDFSNTKYAVPSFYNLYRLMGHRVRDDERGTNIMLDYFSEFFTAEQLKQNMQTYNLEKMFCLVKECFRKEYGYDASNIELNNLYQRTINSYIYNDKKNPAIIHIDELFESTMMAFLLAMLKWAKDFTDLEVYGHCYRYVLFLMNDVCILGEMQGENANRAMLSIVEGDLQILQLAEDCYWTVLAFSLAHEIAHSYFASIGREYNKNNLIREEYEADEIAYDIVLKIIMSNQTKGIVLEPYTYLAPMMYMDFFEMVFYTDRVLYKTYLFNKTHPALKKRKSRLFAIVDMEQYDFDTREGNQLYRAFNQVFKEYKIQTLLKMERGKLTKILRVEQREQLRERREDR